MSEAPHTASEPEPLSQARRVDEVCYRFEAAWKAAASPERWPRIEDYLTDTPEPERSDLGYHNRSGNPHHETRCCGSTLGPGR